MVLRIQSLQPREVVVTHLLRAAAAGVAAIAKLCPLSRPPGVNLTPPGQQSSMPGPNSNLDTNKQQEKGDLMKPGPPPGKPPPLLSEHHVLANKRKRLLVLLHR